MGEWKEYRLDELATIVDCEHKTAPTVEQSEYCSIRTSDISNGKIDFHGANRVLYDIYIEWTARITPREGDIILAREAPVGEVGLIKKGYNVCLGQRTVLLQINNADVSNLYLLYYLVHPSVKHELTSRSTGSVVSHLNMKDIRAFEIYLPHLSEQKAIASVLSSLDDKIDLLHRQNKTLEAMAETLFRQWLDELDYSSTIADLIDVQNGFAFKSKDFKDTGENRVIKIKNISGAIVDINNTDFIDDSVVDSIRPQFNISSGDILFAMTGAKIGKMGLIPQTKSILWLNQRVGLFREKFNGSRFLAYLQLKSDWGKDYIDNTATGSAQPNISGTGIENCEFPKLTTDQIVEYSNVLAQLFDKVIFNLGQIRTLEKLRDTVLPKLMNGEVRVGI